MNDHQQAIPGDRRYVLSPTCRVRQEGFGLLFYDMRGPRLLFANTGDVLRPGIFTGDVGVENTLVGLEPPRRRQLLSFLDSLVERGFLREQPVC